MESQSAGHAERASGHIWRFADCELDERRRELRIRGAPVDIEAKPLEVLQQLLRHAGEVVTKTELLESVWPGTAVVDGSLATAISKVRKLLGDDHEVIVTVPRVGYKLAVSVYCKAPPVPAWADLHLSPGQRVPGREQWRLVRSLDLSPSSEVWLAEHPKTHETRVFKFASDEASLKCLKREVTVARLLRESLGDCPEFVRVLEWNFDTRPYFVESEYAGLNQAEWAEAQGGLGNVAWDLRLKLLVDVARAVAAAHELDILHKDLKPGNILVASTPQGTPQITVADFGRASLLATGRLGALGITNLGFTRSSTDKDSLTGTVMYVAPEVLAGQSPTAASDVYALGVLLYQLAVGDFRRPLAPGWEADISDPLIREDVARAACGDPARRFKTAAELVDRLVNLDRRRAEAEDAQRGVQLAERRQAKARIRQRWLVLAAVALVVSATVAGIVSRRSSSVTPRLKTVAVLPFQNVGSDSTVDFLRLALPDEIATRLSHTRGLAVRPFSTTSKYEQAALDLQVAGREMQADSVVTGHFIKAGGQLHITLEAIDVATNGVLWRDKVDAPAESMIATQVQIALRVRGGLAPALGTPAMDAAAEPKNDQAYDLFLRSLAVPFDPETNPKGIAMLERAVQLDTSYAPAWLTLGRRYYVEDRLIRGGDAGKNYRYQGALERAVTIDPGYIPAAAGLVVSRADRGELVKAHERAQDLVRRRPDSVDAHFVLSYVLRFAGLWDESASHCERALLLDPQTQTAGLRSCAILFLLRGDYPRALTYLNLDRGSAWWRAISLDVLVRQGKKQDALEIGSPRIPQWASYDLLLACVHDRKSSEIDGLARAVRPAEDPEANYLSAAHLAYCGQTDAAGGMLRRAIDGNYCSYPAMDSDPLFADLRAKPEYADLRAAGITCQATFLAQRRQRRR